MSYKAIIPKITSFNDTKGFLVTESGHWADMSGYKAFDQQNGINSSGNHYYHNRGNVGDWLKIKFPKIYTIKRLYIESGGSDINFNAYHVKFDIMGSNDDKNYTKITDVTFNNYQLDDTYGYVSKHTIDINVKCKYIKIVTSNNSYGHIAIFQVYEKLNYLFKTSDKYIGGGEEFSLDTSLLDIKTNDKSIPLTEIVTKLKNINEPCKVIKIV